MTKENWNINDTKNYLQFRTHSHNDDNFCVKNKFFAVIEKLCLILTGYSGGG